MFRQGPYPTISSLEKICYNKDQRDSEQKLRSKYRSSKYDVGYDDSSSDEDKLSELYEYESDSDHDESGLTPSIAVDYDYESTPTVLSDIYYDDTDSESSDEEPDTRLYQHPDRDYGLAYDEDIRTGRRSTKAKPIIYGIKTMLQDVFGKIDDRTIEKAELLKQEPATLNDYRTNVLKWNSKNLVIQLAWFMKMYGVLFNSAHLPNTRSRKIKTINLRDYTFYDINKVLKRANNPRYSKIGIDIKSRAIISFIIELIKEKIAKLFIFRLHVDRHRNPRYVLELSTEDLDVPEDYYKQIKHLIYSINRHYDRLKETRKRRTKSKRY